MKKRTKNITPHRLVQHHRNVKRQRTPKQIKVNKSFSQTKNFWNRMTQKQRDSWNAAAVDDETAYNAFIRLNWYHFYNELEPLTTPPGVV